MLSTLHLIIFVLITAGITSVITTSSLLSPVREYILKKSEYFGEMVHCPMCMGFWVGAAVSSMSFGINPIYGGAIASFMSWSLVSFVDMMQTISSYAESKIE